MIGILILTATIFVSGEQQGRISVTDREIIEKLNELDKKLIRLEEGQKALNQRIDDVNTGLGKRIDNLQGLIWVILAGMFVLFGFVVWDRKTALSPVIRKTRELEESDILVLKALKEYARKEPKLAEILKSFGVF